MRIGTCNGVGKSNATGTADLCAFSKCFGTVTAVTEQLRLSSTSLVLQNAATSSSRTEEPSTYLEEMNTKVRGRFQKTNSTSWPRCGHKTYPVAAAGRNKYSPLKSCADVRRERMAAGEHMPDVIGALDDLSKTIDEQIVHDHVTLIKVRQSSATATAAVATDQRTVLRGRLEYVKDLMSTDETSEESLKADEEVRSYMAAAAADDDDDCSNNEDDVLQRQQPSPRSECKNLKKLISTVNKNIKQSHCSVAQSISKSLNST